MSMKNRLDSLEGQIGCVEQRVKVVRYPGETHEQARQKLERWKQGETLKDVRSGMGGDDPYDGGSLSVIYVRFVKSGECLGEG